jgi:hypothetical protein
MSALALRRSPLSGRMFAAALGLVYGLPLALGMMSDLSHGAFHALESLEQHRAEAAALGLVHTSGRATYTHTHDGVTHSHAGAVDALLVAAEQTDEDAEAAVPVVKLSVHVPAAAAQLLIGLAVAHAVDALDAIVPDHPRALPPVPPPRT